MEKQKDIEKLSEVMELQELPLEYTGITLNNQDIDLMMIANSETFDDLRERLERITNIKTTINPNASIEDERQRVFDLYMQSLIPKVESLKKPELRLSKKIEYFYLIKTIITKEKLLESAVLYGNSPYGEHLKRVAEGRLFYTKED